MSLEIAAEVRWALSQWRWHTRRLAEEGFFEETPAARWHFTQATFYRRKVEGGMAELLIWRIRQDALLRRCGAVMT